MRTVLCALTALAALAAPAALAKEEAPPTFRVIHENAVIHQYPVQIRETRVQRDGSIVIEGRGDRWYRITLDEGCSRLINRSSTIAFGAAPGERLDKNSVVHVSNAGPCLIRALDEIAPPERAG